MSRHFTFCCWVFLVTRLLSIPLVLGELVRIAIYYL